MNFYLSKILWIFLNPFNLFIISIIFFFIFNYSKKKIISYFFLIFITLYVFIVGCSPIGKYLLYSLEKNYHNSHHHSGTVDGILILGGATGPLLSREYELISLGESAERLYEAIILMKKNKNAKVIFSGGSGSLDFPELSHAKVAKQFFESFGMKKRNIIFDSKSRNTYENILYSKKIVKPQINENWLVITSAFHMRRALLLGEKNNWDLIPYPVDFRLTKKIKPSFNLDFYNNFKLFQLASHEWIGLIAYYFMGRINTIFYEKK